MEQTRRRMRIYILFLSVLIVCIAVNIMIRTGVDLETLIIAVNGNELNHNKDTMVKLMAVVLLKRLKQLAILTLLMYFSNTAIVYNVFWIVICSVVSFFVTIQTYYLGIAGVILFLLCIFPHYIFYCMLARYEYLILSKSRIINMTNVLVIVLIFACGIVGETFFSRLLIELFQQDIVHGYM